MEHLKLNLGDALLSTRNFVPQATYAIRITIKVPVPSSTARMHLAHWRLRWTLGTGFTSAASFVSKGVLNVKTNILNIGLRTQYGNCVKQTDVNVT
jgi:hypothetical protein